jgi:hypothetical protein
MAEYKDILAIAKQLESESVGSKKEKEDDLAGEFQEDFQHEASEHEDSKVNWSFLKEVPDYMKCNVCFNIFVDPQLLSCCGRNICKSCIENHVRRVSSLRDQIPSCPYCREEGFQPIKNSALEVSINQLKIQCPYQSHGCGWNGAMRDGMLHLKECKFFLMDCPNQCGCEKFSRIKLSDHLSKCTHQYTSCPFQEVGCKAEMLRKEMNGHTEDDIHQHLLFIAQSNMQASSECKSALASFNTNCDSSLKQSTIVDTIASHKMELATLQSTIETLEAEVKQEQRSIDSLSSSVNVLEVMVAQLRCTEDQAEASKDIYEATIKEVQALPIPTAIGVSSPPVTFTIDNFKKRKAMNNRWLSPPFYTHSGGYKMCLSVYPNGHSYVRGEFVSISIHFMTGEFDDHLTWPFPGGIFTITAIRQRGNKSNRSVHIEVHGNCTRRMRSKQIDGSYGDGVGESKFLDTDDVLRSFLIDGCFKIMVYRIQFLPL